MNLDKFLSSQNGTFKIFYNLIIYKFFIAQSSPAVLSNWDEYFLGQGISTLKCHTASIFAVKYIYWENHRKGSILKKICNVLIGLLQDLLLTAFDFVISAMISLVRGAVSLNIQLILLIVMCLQTNCSSIVISHPVIFEGICFHPLCPECHFENAVNLYYCRMRVHQ